MASSSISAGTFCSSTKTSKRMAEASWPKVAQSPRWMLIVVRMMRGKRQATIVAWLGWDQGEATFQTLSARLRRCSSNEPDVCMTGTIKDFFTYGLALIQPALRLCLYISSAAQFVCAVRGTQGRLYERQ